jgi:ZIP family zinc transporter
VTFEQIGFVLIPPLLLIISGMIASSHPPSMGVRIGILHFAAGVVLAVVAVELLPDLRHEHEVIHSGVGFALGVIAMFGVRYVTEHKEEDEESGATHTAHDSAEPHDAHATAAVAAPVTGKTAPLSALPTSMVAAIVVDLAIDGLMIGIGFAAGAHQGRLLAIALSTELLSLGLALGATMFTRKVSKGRAFRMLAMLPVGFIIGAGLGLSLLRHLSPPWLSFVLSVGAAALLFLVTEELLIEAHKEKETAWMTAMFFVGFFLMMMLGLLE